EPVEIGITHHVSRLLHVGDLAAIFDVPGRQGDADDVRGYQAHMIDPNRVGCWVASQSGAASSNGKQDSETHIGSDHGLFSRAALFQRWLASAVSLSM